MLLNDDVAVVPKYAYPADSPVVDAFASSRSSDVVADTPLAGCVNGSLDVVMKLESLLNHDSLIDDEAIVCTNPLVPVYANPCVSDGK